MKKCDGKFDFNEYIIANNIPEAKVVKQEIVTEMPVEPKVETK